MDSYQGNQNYILSAPGLMDNIIEVDTVIRVQILDEDVCLSHSANTLGKGMNPTILPPAMVKIE